MSLQFQINTSIKYISRKGLSELPKKYPVNSPQYIKTLKHRATAVTVCISQKLFVELIKFDYRGRLGKNFWPKLHQKNAAIFA